MQMYMVKNKEGVYLNWLYDFKSNDNKLVITTNYAQANRIATLCDGEVVFVEVPYTPELKQWQLYLIGTGGKHKYAYKYEYGMGTEIRIHDSDERQFTQDERFTQAEIDMYGLGAFHKENL